MILAICTISATGFAQLTRREVNPGAAAQALGTGWPHEVLTATSTSCGRDPGPNEVLVYKDSDFRGSCAALVPGFYPHAESLLVGNDAISSIKVGSGVRARVFKDQVYGGDYNLYSSGSRNGGLGGSWNDVISSMRVEPAGRSELCADVMEGEFAVYRDSNKRGDCVVLPASGQYENADAMGIANDSISSVWNNSSHTFDGWPDGNFKGAFVVQAKPHTTLMNLPTLHGGTGDFDQNDAISSINFQ
ncbi:MAG TPA: hypothetical protein VF765_33985 [Polyangiaceae bacterium]